MHRSSIVLKLILLLAEDVQSLIFLRSGVDVYTTIVGVVGALYGPFHGGANEEIEACGFGHCVYKNYDPRAKVLRKLTKEVFCIVGCDPLIKIVVALEKNALPDEYFIKRKLYPNIDFYSGLIYW
ncbi:hypothetical protein VNO78_21610 [Psophocarpus tetragonolobus]|uniref:Citrate synthase n=1 Tax=Psophocarpus tetragonolobus TaxID=3891 RepID=A0AAN9SC06_PSOTE